MTLTTPTPFHVASTAQQMARFAPPSDAVIFNKVAMISMGVVAVASVVQILQPLLRDLNAKHRKAHNRGNSR